jgi:hypothetical protein
LSTKVGVFTLQSGDLLLEVVDLLHRALVPLIRKRDPFFKHG